MDTTPTYILMCEKATEIQDSHKLKSVYADSKCKEEHYLDKMDFYAIHNKDGYWYCSNFANDYVGNYSVLGYVKIPKNIQGCAVRSDLPKVFEYSQVIWLPRQDQLCKLCTDMGGVMNIPSLCRFMDFVKDQMKEDYSKFDSLEKLWLAYYMTWNHFKIWNGANWVMR